MLVELKIENFGIIEQLRMRLGPGLNVITGETGSGKSLILQAIDAVLGSRAGAGMVRTGSHRAGIEALFEVGEQKHLRKWLEKSGFPAEDSYIVLAREIAVDGKGRSSINGIPTRLSNLRALSSQLIEVHGQHEHQRILDPETHLDGLDLFAGARPLREQVGELYHKFAGIKKRLRAVSLEAGERERRLDFLRFALEEIESFEPVENEYEELLNERALIQNSGRMYTDICAAYEALREEEHSILDRLTSIETILENYSDIHAGLDAKIGELRESRYGLESLADYLRENKDKLQFSPERLEDIEERIAGYNRLHKKYGGNTVSVLRAQEEFLRETSMIEMSDEESELLRSEIEVVHSELRELAEELSRKRRAVIPALEEQLKKELKTLGMPGAEICVSVKRELASDDYSGNFSGGLTDSTDSADSRMRPNRSLVRETSQSEPPGRDLSRDARHKYLINERGLDRVEFLLRANTGEASLPLRKVASGGEMSRIMLALKSIIIDSIPVNTVIFDEVDSGVGGEVAHSIATRLKNHSLQSQVVVVTHLHQIASLGERHFYISKQTRDGRTTSSIQLLQGDKRLHELARMLGGNAPGPVVLEHARELLSRATG